MKFITDIHLDLSMNALEWNRDLTKSILEINNQEKGLVDKPDREKATVSLQAMRDGNIGFCVATQIASISKYFCNQWRIRREIIVSVTR